MAGPISLEVVTPLGMVLEQAGLDEVVVRRRERRFEKGSEIAVFPSHGPLLVRLAPSTVRYVRGRARGTFHVDSGFAEVHDDRVTLVVAGAEVAGRTR